MCGRVRSFARSYLAFIEDHYGFTFARQEVGRSHASDSSANNMQTSALIFLSSAGIDGSFDVADQIDTPSSEIGELCDTDRTARRREGTCAIAFSPDIQLLPTTINDDRTMGQSAARDSQNPDTPIPESCIRHG